MTVFWYSSSHILSLFIQLYA